MMIPRKSPSSKISSLWFRFWNFLVEPHQKLEDETQRREAKVLASLLIILLPLYFLPEGIRAIISQQGFREVSYFIFGFTSLAAAYLLSRSRAPHWGARLTMLYFSLTPFVALAVYPERYQGADAGDSLIWSVPIVVMGLILLRPEHMKRLVFFTMGLFLAVPAVWEGLSYDQIFPTFWLILAMGVLLIVAAHFQQLYLKQIIAQKQEMEASETRYREMFVGSPVALWESDFSQIKGRLDALIAAHGKNLMAYISAHPETMEGAATSVLLLDANQAALELYETDDVEALKQSIHLVASANEMLALRDGVIDLWMGGRNNPIETVHKTLQGNIKNVVVRMAVGLGYEETWERVIISIIDVTERRATETLVRKLASAVEASASSVVITNLDGGIEYVNPAFSRVTGYSEAEALDENPRVLKSGQHTAEFYQDMWQTLVRGETWQGEIVNKKKNGELYWEHATISPVKDEAGIVANYVAVKDDITEQKQAEREIRRQGEFLQTIIDGIDSPFYVLNVDDYSVALANKKAKETGVASRNHCYALTHKRETPCDGLEHPCPLKYVMKYKEPYVVEHIHYHADGSPYHVEVYGYPIYDENGEVVQMIEYSVDISARKKAEEQAEQLLQEQISVRKALEAITSTLDLDEVLHKIAAEIGDAANATSAYIWLWDEAEHTGTNVAEYFSPNVAEAERVSSLGKSYAESSEDFIAALNENRYSVAHVGDAGITEKYHQHMLEHGAKSALYIPIQLRGETVAFAEIWESRQQREFKPDEIVLCQHIAQNAAIAISNARSYQQAEDEILRRKMTERELRKLSSAVEQAATAIVVTNLKGIIEFVNPAFSQITGYTEEEAIGQTPNILKSGEHEKEFYDEIWQKVERGEVWRGEIINRRKDGSLYWEFQTISPVVDSTGEMTHYVAVKENITRRKELEQALTLAHEEALVASDLKTKLLANVSHDMRTPLGAIMGYTEMLQMGVFEPLNDEQAEAARAISASTQRLLDFVNNLLSQAQIETGKIVLNNALFKPTKLLDALGTEIAIARTKGLDVSTEIDPNLPDRVVGDSYWLGQVLHNLFSNAIKFTPTPGKINVQFLRRNDAQWALRIADTGKGIPPDAQNYIFETFRQVDGELSRQEHTGSGLGLSIVNHLVTLMNGNIELESELGAGSAFTIVLPLNLVVEENAA